jgi:hypothetical protein
MTIWTWEKVYELKRNKPDAGVQMSCGKIMAKLTKGIPLIENDIRYLNRIENKSIVIISEDRKRTKKLKWIEAQSYINSGKWERLTFKGGIKGDIFDEKD